MVKQSFTCAGELRSPCTTTFRSFILLYFHARILWALAQRYLFLLLPQVKFLSFPEMLLGMLDYARQEHFLAFRSPLQHVLLPEERALRLLDLRLRREEHVN